MSDMGEMFNDLKKIRQEKRADNRENSAEYLVQREIPFVSKNGGAHLIAEGRECPIDFWPGTGKWHSRCGKKGFGVRNLVAFIGAPNAEVTGRASATCADTHGRTDDSELLTDGQHA